MSAPEIVTYVSMDPDAPSHMTYAAAMVPRIVPAKGKVPAYTEAGTSWVCTAPTAEEARAILERQWAKDHPDTSKRGAHLRRPKPEDLEIVL